MKITVQKKAVDKAVKKQVDLAIAKAKEAAESGRDEFSFSYPAGISGFGIIDGVEQETEGTVLCQPKGHSTGFKLITFSIYSQS